MKRAGVLLLGLLLGLGLGLGYAWFIRPAPPANVAPAALITSAQAQYIEWIAEAYAVDRDAARAQARLAALGAGDFTERVTALAQQRAAQNAEPSTVQALAQLAAVLGQGPVAITPAPTLTATNTAIPAPTPTPTITPIPLPTHPPTPTPVGALSLASQQLVCEPRPVNPLIQVLALDALGQPLPGVEVLVEWNGGFDRFFTGLKPEQGAGYGDFAMLPGVTYTVRLALNPAAPLADVSAPECVDATTSQTYLGSWLLTFRGQ